MKLSCTVLAWALWRELIFNTIDCNAQKLLNTWILILCIFKSYSKEVFLSLGHELNIFFFLPDRVAEGEFIQGVLDNEEALRLIQYQPGK